MRKAIPFLILIIVLLLGMSLTAALAQTTTTGSNVTIFFVTCADKGVVNFSGQMRPGYDIYYQIFSAPGGGGVPLTALRRASVDGNYAFSEEVPYANAAIVNVGQVASVKVSIAREGDSSRSVFNTTVNDIQDGCAAPQHPTGVSTDLGGSAAAESTEAPGSGVLSPFGGEVNPGVVPQPLVKIGARPIVGRSLTPGLIFAECDEFPLTNPGVLYDTDDLTVFWSWFARTQKQVQDHIAHAQYSVKLNGQFFPNVEQSAITQRGRNFWVFYTAHLGRFWQPGQYGIEYGLTWDQKISDGYDDWGPGTKNEKVYSTCTFQVQPNPWGLSVVHVGLPFPNQP